MYDKVKEVIFNPITPIVLGIVNLVFAEDVAGVSIGCILLMAGVSDWYENKER